MRYARKCCECSSGMNEGYLVYDSYYCSDECLQRHYTQAEWSELHENEPDQCYYTEWEDDDHYFEVDMEFVKFLFCTFDMDDVFNIAFQIGTDWYDLRYDLLNNDVIVKCKNKIVHREKIFE